MLPIFSNLHKSPRLINHDQAEGFSIIHNLLRNSQFQLDSTEQIFDSHYSKIPEYKRSVRQQLTNRQKEPIVVGFFIENQYTPIVSCSDRKHEELYYFETIQFARKIADSPDLDFILFGSWYQQNPQIFYIDCKDRVNLQKSNVDLSDPSIRLSPLNNELTFYTNLCID